MKKFSFYFVLVCLFSLCTFGLIGCNQTNNVTVNWQTGRNYTFVDEAGATLSGEVEYEQGTVVNFKVEATSVLVVIENVTIDGEVVTVNTDGYYQLTASKDTAVACTSTVLDNEVKSIAVTTAPTKTTYYIGDAFDSTGMVVEATYADGSKKAVTTYSVVYSEGTALKLGDTSVTISHTDEFNKTVTTTVNVTVEDVTATAMNVTGTLAKTEYFGDDELTSIEGLTVELTFSNGTKRALAFNDLTVVYATANATSFTNGDTSFTLKYNDLTHVVTGITVREIEPFSGLSAELVIVNGVPSLLVKGTLVDAKAAMVVLRESNLPVATQEATITGSTFEATVDLSVLTKDGTWHDVTVYYDDNRYVDLMDDEAVDFSTAVIYAQGKRCEFKDWAHNLKVNFSNYTTANVITSMAAVSEMPTITISGICYGVTELYIYVGDEKYVQATVTNDTFTATFNVSTLGLAFGTHNLTVATSVGGEKSAIAAPQELGDKITLETTEYSLVNVATNAAVALQDLALPNNVEITTVENVPTLIVSGTTSASTLKVSLDGEVVDATVLEGAYRAELDLRNILLLGQGFEIGISTDDGATYTTLTKDNATFEGTVDYRLTTSPGGDKYAKNTYMLLLNGDNINVGYYQTVYKSDDSVYTVITYFSINNEDKLVLSYQGNINTWGALKKGDWIWLDNGSTVDGIATRVSQAALSKGIWTFEYTSDQSPQYQIVYEGNKEFVQVTDNTAFIVINGKILVANNMNAYGLEASVEVVGEDIVLTVTGKYYVAPTGEGTYKAHAWYGTDVDLVGQINEDLTFSYTYTITNTSKVDTMWLHMFDNGDQLNMFGVINELKNEASIASRKVELVYDNSAIIARVTEISAE